MVFIYPPPVGPRRWGHGHRKAGALAILILEIASPEGFHKFVEDFIAPEASRLGSNLARPFCGDLYKSEIGFFV